MPDRNLEPEIITILKESSLVLVPASGIRRALKPPRPELAQLRPILEAMVERNEIGAIGLTKPNSTDRKYFSKDNEPRVH